MKHFKEYFPVAHTLFLILVLSLVLVGLVRVWLAPAYYDTYRYYDIVGYQLMGLGTALWLDMFIADKFFGAAVAKGFTDAIYLSMPFVFTIIGYLLVIALPSRSSLHITTTHSTGDQ